MPLARRCGNAPAELFGAHINLGKHMKIRHAPLAVVSALTMAVAATANAAPVTYTFGGTVDRSDGVQAVAGDAFTGSFTYESTASGLPIGPEQSFYAGLAINVTVNGYTYSSNSTSSDCPSCGGVVVLNAVGSDSFELSNFNPLVGDGAPVKLNGVPTLASTSGNFAYIRLGISYYDDTTFGSTALPANVLLGSAIGQAVIYYGGEGDAYTYVVGSVTDLTLISPPPVPEASTSAMLALGLSALAFVRRRKSH